MVGRGAIQSSEKEVHNCFPCCPFCGSKKLVINLVPDGRDTLSCSNCKARWHLIIGLGGLKWAELNSAAEDGTGKELVGRLLEKGNWKKMAEKAMSIYTN